MTEAARRPQIPVRVMLVDDSAVMRALLAKNLSGHDGIAVVAKADNGSAALVLAAQHRPDVILLDIEMPHMDGMTALPELLKTVPEAKIIMVSTLTVRNAQISLRALALGASDCVAKPSSLQGAGPAETENFYRQLREKILALGKASPAASRPAPPLSARKPGGVTALALASSTGGPQALMTLLEGLKGKLPSVPIFITQHMPPIFTGLLAEHLSVSSGRPCHEARHGQEVLAGHAYLAPGDFHMTVEKKNGAIVIALNQQPPENYCRPSADPMLRSLSAAYGSGLLAAVLTGMGSDGLEGARRVIEAGGAVIAQDESTSVVWGMPRAVAENGLCRAVLPLPRIAPYLAEAVNHAD